MKTISITLLTLFNRAFESNPDQTREVCDHTLKFSKKTGNKLSNEETKVQLNMLIDRLNQRGIISQELYNKSGQIHYPGIQITFSEFGKAIGHKGCDQSNPNRTYKECFEDPKSGSNRSPVANAIGYKGIMQPLWHVLSGLFEQLLKIADSSEPIEEDGYKLIEESIKGANLKENRNDPFIVILNDLAVEFTTKFDYLMNKVNDSSDDSKSRDSAFKLVTKCNKIANKAISKNKKNTKGSENIEWNKEYVK